MWNGILLWFWFAFPNFSGYNLCDIFPLIYSQQAFPIKGQTVNVSSLRATYGLCYIVSSVLLFVFQTTKAKVMLSLMAIQKWASDCSLATSTQIVSLAWPFLSTSISLKAKTRLFHIPSQWSAQCSWVTQSCPTLCDPMDCSTSGFPVHQLPELAQTHVLSSRWCHSTISSSVVPFSSCLQSFPPSGSFQMSHLLASGGQSIGISASTSVLRMNTQDWSHLGWTGWNSLQSKELSRVFSNTTV